MKLILTETGELIFRAGGAFGDASGTDCCCEGPGCTGCLSGDILSHGACPHSPGDTLTLVLQRPTRIQDASFSTCGGPDGCYGCGKITIQGGPPVKLRYAWESRNWVFYPPSYAFDGDPGFPACQRAGPQNPCSVYVGCTEGGVAVPPFVVPLVPCQTGAVDACTGGPTLFIPPSNTWIKAVTRFDLPCDTASEAQCCDPCGNFTLPVGCWSCGMSKYQHRMSTAYPWARELMLYRCGEKPFGPIHDENGAQVDATSDLWQQFLGFAHSEVHYLFDPSCREIPPELLGPDGETSPPLASIVPKLFIFACSGVPMFEFDFLDAAADGVIDSFAAMEAIKTMRRLGPLAFNLSPAEVNQWRATIAALEGAGRMRTVDWRGEAAAELTAAAGKIPGMAACATTPQALQELWPVRKNHYPALDPRKVIDTAKPGQPHVCEGFAIAPGSPSFLEWSAIQHTYFRCAPGGWTFAAWAFGNDETIPEDPKLVWYGRDIGHNVIPHSQIAAGSNTDYAWNPSGIPNITTCVSTPCGGPPPPFCTQVDVCDPDIPCPALVPACDDRLGHVAYGGTCDLFVAAYGQYGVEFSQQYGSLCTCRFDNTSYVVRGTKGCVFDVSSVPWTFRAKADGDDDVLVQPQATYPVTFAACSTCQGLNLGVPPFSPSGGSDSLCPGHACWDALQICGGLLVVDESIFTAPSVGAPICQGAAL